MATACLGAAGDFTNHINDCVWTDTHKLYVCMLVRTKASVLREHQIWKHTTLGAERSTSSET